MLNLIKQKIDPVWIIVVGLCVTFLAIIALAWQIFNNYQSAKLSLTHDFTTIQLRSKIIHLDTVLNMSIQMAAATGNPYWEQRYFNYTDKLNAAKKEAIALTSNNNAIEAVDADKADAVLTNMENEVFKLVRLGKLKEAQDILSSTEYKTQRNIYTSGLLYFSTPQQNFLHLVELQGIITTLDEVLTMSARMAASTGDLNWEKHYRQSEPILDQAIKEVAHSVPELSSRSTIEKTDAANLALVTMENQAFDLVRTGDLKKAQEILFSPQYEKQKQIYADGMQEFYTILSHIVNQEITQKMRSALLLVAAEAVAIIIIFIAWFLIISIVSSWKKLALETNQKLTQLNSGLDQKVAQQTENLQKANAQLTEEIKKHKQAEADKKAIQEQLMQSQKMEALGSLASGVAHDFNNLLGGILGYATILKTRYENDPETTKQIDIIIQSIARGAELTKQLLCFSRKELSHKKVFILNETVLETRNILYRTLEKDTTMKTELAKDLWPIEGDPSQISQALINLGINARDAMPKGGEIWFETQNIVADESYCKIHKHLKPGKYVRISVTDTGTGIPQQIINKIFDPFFTTKEPGKGTGLGLSLVYGIMQNHHGIVSVYSEQGQGSVFYLYFPAKLDDSALQPLSTTAAPPRVINANLDGKTILLADDEEIMRELAKDILEPKGVRILLAKNGEEALKIYQNNQALIDLAIIDIIMPKMDGLKLFAHLKQINPGIKVLFSSGYIDNEQVQELKKQGNVDFINKPFNGAMLVEKVLDII